MAQSHQSLETPAVDPEKLDDQSGSTHESVSHQITWRRKVFENRGIFLSLLAALLFAIKTILFRLVEDDVHVIQISFSLLFAQIFYIIPVVVFRGVSLKIESMRILALLLSRSFSGVIAVCLFYYAVDYMKLGDVTAIALSAPVFVGIFGKVILKESFGCIDCVLVVVVIAGVVLISQPHFIFRGRGGDEDGADNVVNLLATLSAFGCCISLSLVFVFNRKMGLLDVDSFFIVFYYIIFGSLGLGFVTTVSGNWSIPSCGRPRYAFVAMGLCAFLGQSLSTYSLSITNGFLVSIVQSNEVIFAYFLEFLLFQVSPDIISLVGAVLVVASSSVTSLRKIGCQTNQQRAQEETEDGEGCTNDSEEMAVM